GCTVLAAVLLLQAPRSQGVVASARPESGGAGLRQAWRAVAANRAFRRLLAAFMLNGNATAIPATLVLFFVQDVLGADNTWTAIFLASYFFSGALGMPVWTSLSSRIGLRNAWLSGMGIAVVAFIGTLWIGQGDMLAFLLICALTGLALGSDLALPAAMLSGVIARAQQGNSLAGAYFGVWNLATKANLALAAGIMLPALSWTGYAPGQANASTLALSLAYAAVPCALKLLAGVLLMLSPKPVDDDRNLAPNGATQ
ncbi:MAG: MFS transporter, partial [Quisquiliibacterium sp.]